MATIVEEFNTNYDAISSKMLTTADAQIVKLREDLNSYDILPEALADLVAAWNFFQNLNANDYVEIMWSSTDTNLLINWTAATTTPVVKPSIPSIILTVQQIY